MEFFWYLYKTFGIVWYLRGTHTPMVLYGIKLMVSHGISVVLYGPESVGVTHGTYSYYLSISMVSTVW